MAHEFKAGDLALIVNARVRYELIGRVVELHQRVAPGESYEGPGENGKITINGSGEYSWVCLGDFFRFEIRSEFGGEGWAQVKERHLMPLRGEFEPEQKKSKEAEPCA